jgi:hypothetical protein
MHSLIHANQWLIGFSGFRGIFQRGYNERAEKNLRNLLALHLEQLAVGLKADAPLRMSRPLFATWQGEFRFPLTMS